MTENCPISPTEGARAVADADKSLQEIDGQDWGEPHFGSHLVRECHRLRHVPIRDLSPEDLRLLLSQAVGVDHLLPIALDYLDTDPFAAGDYHPGDLLREVLVVSDAIWAHHPMQRRRAEAIATRALTQLGNNAPDMSNRVAILLRERLQEFIGETKDEHSAE
jgi:hypothetical protein